MILWLSERGIIEILSKAGARAGPEIKTSIGIRISPSSGFCFPPEWVSTKVQGNQKQFVLGGCNIHEFSRLSCRLDKVWSRKYQCLVCQIFYQCQVLNKSNRLAEALEETYTLSSDLKAQFLFCLQICQNERRFISILSENYFDLRFDEALLIIWV